MKQPLTILIVEDEGVTAMGMAMELSRAGYKVDKFVATGEEAIARVEQVPPDLILMDIRLAGQMNGLEAARQIRTFCSVPIIFMTGYEKDDVIEQVKQVELSNLLFKPMRLHQLKSAIDSLWGT